MCDPDPVLAPQPDIPKIWVEKVTLWTASTNDDFHFVVKPDKSMWLRARGRGSISESNRANACEAAALTEIRVDGLGRGAAFCIVTDAGLHGYLYIRAEVVAGSDSVSIGTALQR